MQKVGSMKKELIGLQIDTGLNRLGIQIKELINKDLKNINLFILLHSRVIFLFY